MAKPAARIAFLEAVLLLGGAMVLGRSFWLQVVHHQVWEDNAAKRRERERDTSARRGGIYDRSGRPLAVSHEQYHVSISLNRVRDTAALQATMVRMLPGRKSRILQEFGKPNPYFYGPFGAEDVEPIRRNPGVHLEVLRTRQYPMQSLADRVLGRLDQDSAAGIEGMEKALDTLLRGRPGRERLLIDRRGNVFQAPDAVMREPVSGHDVWLTIDADLQGIAEAALRQAVEAHGAHGGDVVILSVTTGELLAVASLRTDTATGRMVSTSSAIVEPYEPGSTAKLFTVAAMLRVGSDTTPVDGEDGVWGQHVGGNTIRWIRDVHHLHGPVTVGKAVRFSSNIAMTKFAEKLQPEQQYVTLRDFGFGTTPGLGFPAETPGRLVRPPWINKTLSLGSLATGYEWEASAVQLAAGYAAFANHGVLLAPALVREVRDESGNVIWAHRPDTVRRAVPDSIAKHVMEYLRLTEDSGGTGEKGQLDRLDLRYPGKTGTAEVKVRTGPKTFKVDGQRTSFIGIFPETNPQIVVYVMVDRPTGPERFGGDVAAPVVKRILQQALLATRSPLDRSWLTEAAAAPHAPPPRTETAAVKRVLLPAPQQPSRQTMAVVPGVAGASAREAVLQLERAGYQVRLLGRARVRATEPAAGDSLPRGAVVTVHADSLP